MPLILPTTPAPRSMAWRPVSARGENRPAFGGPLQRPERTGGRSAFDIELPPMSYRTAMDWADLFAEADTVVMKIHQPGIDTGAPGTPLVNGATSTGSVLPVDGLTPSFYLRKGQWVSVIVSGQRYAYRLSQAVTADGSGAASLTFYQMIRRPIPNNAVVEIANPMVEGFAYAEGQAVTPDRLVHGLRFTIEETE